MREVTLVVHGSLVRCSVERENDNFVVHIGGATYRVRLSPGDPGVFTLDADGRSRIVHAARGPAARFLHIDGYTLEYTVAAAPSAPPSPRPPEDVLTAPMPGAVSQVLVNEGDVVVWGQPLVIVEAMKMEHVIRAPRSGSVRAVRVRPGDKVDGGAVVVEIMERVDDPPR